MGSFSDRHGSSSSGFDSHGSSSTSPSSSHPSAPALTSGPRGGAKPGAHSPAADTVVDERGDYLANKAGMDAKWQGSDMLARALARHRGEKVADQPIKAEPGAPKTSRPLASPQDAIASALSAPSPYPSHAGPTAAPAPAAPHSGPSERDVYMANAAASDERAKKNEFLQRALERYGKKK